MKGVNGDNSGEGSDHSRLMLSEHDQYLPITNEARIMENIKPRTGKVSFKLLTLIHAQSKLSFSRLLTMPGNVSMRVHQLHV